MNLRGPAEHTAEDATPGELRRSVLILLLMLAALALLVAPLLADLPLLGKSTRTAILAWLLVGLALYWMYAGMGYRPLLLVQLLLFSTAAALLSVKLLLVAVTIDSLTVLRWMARYLIIAGAVCAGANLTGMLLALTWQRPNTQN
jgi:carbon starvation protein CstA